MGAAKSKLEKLQWYAIRASRMSSKELLHRFGEQVKRWLDSRRVGSWASFGAYRSEIKPLPGLGCVSGRRLPPEICAAARETEARRFRLLNQSWPHDVDQAKLWHIDPVSGESWPGAGYPFKSVSYRHGGAYGDVKFVWELNRLQFLQPLALAGGSTAAPAIHGWIRSWMEANPPYDGVNWTNGIEAASRLISILVAAATFENSPAGHKQDLLAFIEAHICFLKRYPSLFSSANNHRVAELASTFITACLIPGLPGVREHLDHARVGLEAEILKQFTVDGIGAEQSPNYAAYSLEWFALAGVVADNEGCPLSAAFRARAQAAADSLCWFLSDAGHVPDLGDNDAGRVLSLGQDPEPRYCASVAALVGRWLADETLQMSPRDASTRDLVCSRDQDAEPQSLDRWRCGTHTFPDGGWTVFREVIDNATLCMTFDHAPLGFLSIAAHGHADALAITLSYGPEDIIVDPGTYLYHAGRGRRDWYRGTSAHNTLAFNGQNQSAIAGPFNWRQHARTRLLSSSADGVEAEHDGYRKRFGIIHRRSINHLSVGRYRITDKIIGARHNGKGIWSSGFTLYPSVIVDVVGQKADLRCPSGACVSMFVKEAGLSWQVSRTPYSPSFNVEKHTTRLELFGDGLFQAREITVDLGVLIAGSER